MKKKRKGGSRQHLDKVGTHSHSAAEQEQHAERQAVLDTMGMGGAGGATRVILWTIFALLAVAAIVSLIILTLF
jgi:glycerate kinase